MKYITKDYSINNTHTFMIDCRLRKLIVPVRTIFYELHSRHKDHGKNTK